MREFTVYDEENSAVQDAYALLTANVHFNRNQQMIKTITLTSWTPQVGKTTVAINLAISLAKSGWNTLLVDMDLRKPGSFKRLNSEKTLGIANVIEGDLFLLDVLTATNIKNLTYLPCGSNIENPIELLCSPRFSDVINEVYKSYDFIIFDTPALSSVIDGALVASQTDASLLVAQLGVTKTTSLIRAREQLETAKSNLIGVVINKVKKQEYVRYMESYDYFAHFRNKKNKHADIIEDQISC